MHALVPEVHLFICLDPRVSPGALLHSLDIARAQDWKQETVLICDESWRAYVNLDQPVLFIDRKKVFEGSQKPNDGFRYLEDILEQLDHFEIKQVTQVGDLAWGRWLGAYFEDQPSVKTHVIDWGEKNVSSLELINDLANELALDITAPRQSQSKSASVYIDPYCGTSLSTEFLKLFGNLNGFQLPSWLSIIVKDDDIEKLNQMGLSECLVEYSESESQLFNQSILCFSDASPFAQTSRSYNVALYNTKTSQSLFVADDIFINSKEDIHASELFNILSYWKMKRLKELAFQWLNMGIEIHCLENFHSRVVCRNLLNYSSDLYHCQIMISEFLYNSHDLRRSKLFEIIDRMRKEVSNDPFSLSFSLKILLLIVERMMASATCGERLFERLGSDYHRIIIGETLIEGLIQNSSTKPKELDIKERLQAFHKYLIQIDHFNDQMEISHQRKESA